MSSVCMISSLHGPYDDRIYWKEALSLKKRGYDVFHVTTGENEQDYHFRTWDPYNTGKKEKVFPESLS